MSRFHSWTREELGRLNRETEAQRKELNKAVKLLHSAHFNLSYLPVFAQASVDPIKDWLAEADSAAKRIEELKGEIRAIADSIKPMEEPTQ